MVSLSPAFPGRLARALSLAALAAAVASPAARAVVGGSEEGGALARSSVMVLNSRGGVCSGIVLAPDTILTAGHCASAQDQVRVHYRDGSAAPVLLASAAIATHPGYDSGAIKGRRRSVDMALIRIAEPLPSSFSPASLTDRLPAKGSGVRLGGYGVAREGEARSTGTFRTADLAVVEPYGPSTILLWTSDPEKAGRGACQGDSGGPVALDGFVVAVTSWASGSGRSGCGALSQAILVGPQRGWIDRVLAGWGRSAVWR